MISTFFQAQIPVFFFAQNMAKKAQKNFQRSSLGFDTPKIHPVLANQPKIAANLHLPNKRHPTPGTLRSATPPGGRALDPDDAQQPLLHLQLLFHVAGRAEG